MLDRKVRKLNASSVPTSFLIGLPQSVVKEQKRAQLSIAISLSRVASPGAQPFVWKWYWCASERERKTQFIQGGWAPRLVLKPRRWEQLRNGLLSCQTYLIGVITSHKNRLLFFLLLCSHITTRATNGYLCANLLYQWQLVLFSSCAMKCGMLHVRAR